MSIQSFESNANSSGFGNIPTPHIDTYKEKTPLAYEFEGPAVLGTVETRDLTKVEVTPRDFGKFAVSSQFSPDTNWGLL